MVGGAPQNALAIAEGLRRDRYEVSIACGRGEPSEEGIADRAEAVGIPVHIIPGLQRGIDPRKDLATFWRLFLVIRKGGYQLVHTHLSKAGVLGRLAARAAGVPVIFHTYHGDVFESYFSPLKSRIFLTFERAAAAVSDRFIEVSRATLRRHVAYGISRRDRFRVISNGIDLSRFERPTGDIRTIRGHLDLPPSTPIIATVTRLVPVKRIDVLLKAAEIVVRRCPKVLFVIVGQGESEGFLRKRASVPSLSGKVRFFGHRSDIADLLHVFDVIAISSDDEGHPTSLIEAMAAARPVAATAVGGIPEVVEDGGSGLLVPRRNPDRLAEALLSLLEAPEKAKAMGIRGQNIARERYDVRRMVESVEILYREGLKAKGLEVQG